MKKWSILALTICLLLTGCGQTQQPQKEEPNPPPQEEVQQPEQPQEQTGSIHETPEPVYYPLEMDATSPDGRWEISLAGTKSGPDDTGIYTPESVRIINAATGDLAWEDDAALRQKGCWSPEGDYLALARMDENTCAVTVIAMESGTAFEFALPDGSELPETSVLPENWAVWQDEDSLNLTVQQEESHSYRCSMFPRKGKLIGSVLETTAQSVSGDYDFDRNGTPEELRLVTVWNPEIPEQEEWCELQVWQDNTLLWVEEAGLSHVGWNSLYALRMDGEDFLLRYNPYMNQGAASYQFELFTLENGGEQVVHQERIEFDVNFGSSVHQYFDAEAVANFLWAAGTLIDGSHLLLSTQDGALVSDRSNSDFDAGYFGKEFEVAEHSGQLEEALKKLEGEKGETLASVRKELGDEFDFNHNGISETVNLVTEFQNAGSGGAQQVLEIWEMNQMIWSETAYSAHTGQSGLFACTNEEGKQFLLRYYPSNYHGFCVYSYELFSLDESGNEVLQEEASVEFDLNWNAPGHNFSADKVLYFTENLNKHLAGGKLLLSNPDSLEHINPEDPQETLAWLTEKDLCPEFRHQESAGLKENLQNLEHAMKVAQILEH